MLFNTIVSHIIMLATIHHSNTGPVLSKHMRASGAPETVAAYIEAASDAAGVDAALLTALMDKESSFDRRAVGLAGERGYMQLHGSRKRMWQRLCYADKSQCDYYNVLVGALTLRMYYEKCLSWDKAVGAYRTGRCIVGPKTKQVIDLWQSLPAQ